MTDDSRATDGTERAAISHERTGSDRVVLVRTEVDDGDRLLEITRESGANRRDEGATLEATPARRTEEATDRTTDGDDHPRRPASAQ